MSRACFSGFRGVDITRILHPLRSRCRHHNVPQICARGPAFVTDQNLSTAYRTASRICLFGWSSTTKSSMLVASLQWIITRASGQVFGDHRAPGVRLRGAGSDGVVRAGDGERHEPGLHGAGGERRGQAHAGAVPMTAYNGDPLRGRDEPGDGHDGGGARGGGFPVLQRPNNFKATTTLENTIRRLQDHLHHSGRCTARDRCYGRGSQRNLPPGSSVL